MGTNCAPLVEDLFLFCYERDFMLSLSDNNQTDVIEAFNSTSRYLDDLLNIDNPYFEQMVGQIYPTELQLNKANSSDTEAPFLDLILLKPRKESKTKNKTKNKTNLLILLKVPSREKALLTLHVVTEMHFLLQKTLKNIMHGRVKMYVMR